MGALSFNYSVFPSPKTSTKFFEYRWRIPLTEYRLKYERYAALSDASIFNAPVAVTKVATGVRLYDLFVDKKEKDTSYFQGYQPVSSVHNIEYTSNEVSSYRTIEPSLLDHETILKPSSIYPVNIDTLISLQRTVSGYTSTFESFWASISDYTNIFHLYFADIKDSIVPNEMETIFYRNDRVIHENHEYVVIPPKWNVDTIVFDHEVIPYDEKLVILFQQDRINRPYAKFSPVGLLRVTRKSDPIRVNMHLTYRINRTEAGYVIYPNESAIRVKGDSFIILGDIESTFAWMYDHRDINHIDSLTLHRDVWEASLKYDINAGKEKNEFPYPEFILMGTPSSKFTNSVSESLLASPFRKSINLAFKTLLAAPSFKFTNAASESLLSTPEVKDMSQPWLNYIGAAIDDKHTNISGSNAHGTFDRNMDIPYYLVNSERFLNQIGLIDEINVSRNTRILNIFRNGNILRDRIGFNIFENSSIVKSVYGSSILSQVYGANRGKSGYLGIIFDPYDCFPILKDRITNYFQSYGVYKTNGSINANSTDLSQKVSDDSSLSYYENISASQSNKIAFETSHLSASQYDKIIFETCQYSAEPNNKSVFELTLSDFSVKEIKYTIKLDDVSLQPLGKDLTFHREVWNSSHGKNITELTGQLDAQSNRKDIIGTNSVINAEKERSEANLFEQDLNTSKELYSLVIHYDITAQSLGKHLSPLDKTLLFDEGHKSLASLPPLITVSKSKNAMTVYANVLARNRRKKASIFDYKIILIASDRKGFRIYNHIIPITKEKASIIIWPNQHTAFKERVDMIIWPDQQLIAKSKHGFVVDDTNTLITKSKYPFSIQDTSSLIHKIRHSFIIDDTHGFIYKLKKNLVPNFSELWPIYRECYELSIPEWGTHIYKVHKDILMGNAGTMITKEKYNVPETDSLEGAVRTIYPVAVSHYLKYPNWEQFGGFIVPISRVRYQGMIDYINEFAKKRYRDTMITDGTFGSVLAKPTTLNFDMPIDKLPKKVFLDYINEMLVKTKLKASIEEGTFGFKEPYDVSLQYEEPWGYLSPKEVMIGQEEWTDKESKRLMIEYGQFAFKNKVQAEVFADEWLDKTPYMCYYSYDTWGAKEDSRAFVDSQEMASQNPREVYVDGLLAGDVSEKRAMLQFGDFASKSISNAWYEDAIFSDRLIRSTSVFQQMDWAFKDAHKCDLAPNDFGNWAWVYETPDPFQYDKYGIDELLLPEKDTQYEDFEDLVFDREHMRPRNAIKEISDTEWIAKLPIRHPVGKYEDIGKVYKDSAIKWENYFGIQSSIIHDMFLRYYRIWEKNMFKFSTMTMQQAGNLMLEYIWSWIPDYYPLKDLEQAYRAFRLIRWYTECAIINNSQYIISYEYANLAWPDSEHMGVCHIPSDLQEYDPTDIVNHSNDTMYSDTSPGHLCLRNNSIYTKSNDVWVTFQIMNKRNTTITLSLYNESGSVNIYLNDKVIDVIHAHGSQKLVYNIRYTGDVNEFKIEKKASDNLDNNFIIGHISIAYQSFKDLKIDFDPSLRAGNKPLNEVAQKLIQFAALHDRKDIAYHEMLTKNLGVSEVYKMLVKYWQLHHENKWKGKRLTIKQV